MSRKRNAVPGEPDVTPMEDPAAESVEQVETAADAATVESASDTSDTVSVPAPRVATQGKVGAKAKAVDGVKRQRSGVYAPGTTVELPGGFTIVNA